MYSLIKVEETVINIVLLMTILCCTQYKQTIFIQPVSTEIAMVDILKNTEEGVEQILLPVDVIMRLANTNKNADELIQKIYSESAIKRYRLSQIMQEMPPECVRQLNEGVYFIYKFEHENYLFVFYNSLEDNNYPSIWYLGKKLYLEDFEKLADKKASLETVQSFDQYGDYTSLYLGSAMSLYTFHHTVDGYLVRLDYISEIGKRAEICKITKLSNEDNPIYYNLLPIDKKLINR